MLYRKKKLLAVFSFITKPKELGEASENKAEMCADGPVFNNQALPSTVQPLHFTVSAPVPEASKLKPLKRDSVVNHKVLHYRAHSLAQSSSSCQPKDTSARGESSGKERMVCGALSVLNTSQLCFNELLCLVEFRVLQRCGDAPECNSFLWALRGKDQDLGDVTDMGWL